MSKDRNSKNHVQLVWGAALILMGVAVFFRIPQVMPRLTDMGQSDITVGFLRICFYLIGFILVGGGVKKVIDYFKADDQVSTNSPNDKEDN